MNRRDFLKKIGVSVIVSGLAPCAAAKSAEDRPNFIFILTDDQRHDAMGCAGNPIVRTPNIDALAARGVRFENAFVTLSICSPSRAACLTGRYGSTTGVTTVPGTLNDDEKTIAHLLKDSGYRTGVVGKWHLGNSPASLGFDYSPYFRSNGPYYNRNVIEGDGRTVAEGYIEDYNADKAIDFLEESSRSDAPFFLWLCTQVPHMNHEFDWPARDQALALYDENKIPLPETWQDDLKGKPPYLRESRSRTRALEYGYNDPAKIRRHFRRYYAAITEMDAALGPVLDSVDKLGLRDKTYFLFMGDNGWFMGEHRFTSKVLAYEESIRVPMIVAGPGISPAVSDKLVLNIDLPATILDLAGIPKPQDMHGANLTPLLKARSTQWRTDFLYEAPTPTLGSHRWKYIQTRSPDDLSKIEYQELYDLHNDPAETTNLAGRRQFILIKEQLRRTLDQARASLARSS